MSYVPGQLVYVYDTITNQDEITSQNPTGLVDADPVTVTVTDPNGAVSTDTATRISQGRYRYLVTLAVPGGSYSVLFSGSGLGQGTGLQLLEVGRLP